MAANRTQNAHSHRIRHRLRNLDPGNNLRKFANYLTVQATRLNTIGGVAGVTGAEIDAAHKIPPHFVRARFVRGATTSAEVSALGIPIA